MSEPMREEVELPPFESAECPHNPDVCECDLTGLEHLCTIRPTLKEWEAQYSRLAQRERQLKAALAANREKDAEIARLKLEYAEYRSLGVDEWNLREKEYQEQLASLRASGGEKPEDAWRRAWSVGYFDALNNVDVLRPAPYVAPPTLTREKE